MEHRANQGPLLQSAWQGSWRPSHTLDAHKQEARRQRNALRPSLQRLLDKHGEQHLNIVLVTIIETRGNAQALMTNIQLGRMPAAFGSINSIKSTYYIYVRLAAL